MNADELAAWVAEHRDDVVPFVGSGLTVAAGAPDLERLVQALASRLHLDAANAGAGTLSSLTRRATNAQQLPQLRAALADTITGLRLRPTPALTALTGARSRRILTTNYDDGLERSARARGLEVTSLLPTDPRVLRDPGPNRLHVVHLHGLPHTPESLVLPGTTTNVLDDDDVFASFTRATLAARSVVFLGFSLAMEEVHLHHILRWLSAKVTGGADHFLLLPADEVADREREMEMIAGYGNVKVVAYERDRRHSRAERVALAFAPRAQRVEDREAVTWVRPPLLRFARGEDWQQLAARMRGIEDGWRHAEDLAEPDDLLALRASSIIAGPGAGKTTLLERMLHEQAGRVAAFGRLRDFQTWPRDVEPERAIVRLLHAADGQPVATEALDEPAAVLLLDGLDEVMADSAPQAVLALGAAIERWPNASWIISSRPGSRAEALVELCDATYRIPPSRAWARTYLEARSVPSDRIEHALQEGFGLGDLLCIPLFAERIADRLLDEELDVSIGPLGLLVEEQFVAARREARRHGYPENALAEWLQWVAVALELSGRSSASVSALAAIPGPEKSEALRAALVEATLLGDEDGVVAFPAKPLQEGLAASALLQATDLVGLLRRIASAEVLGVPTLRDDLDVTLDLVFEHAGPDARSQLRGLDEQRWARTAVRSGDFGEAADALEVILAFHAEHELRLGWSIEGGLRNSRSAALGLVRAWPSLLMQRQDELEDELRSPSASARSRALTLLAETHDHRRLAEWVDSALQDDDVALVLDAAAIAARRGLGTTRGRLLELLESRDEALRAAALSALIEIVDVGELPDVVRRLKGRGLSRHASRMLERVDLDTGLELVAQDSGIGSTRAWILERLIDTAHHDAWTPARVRHLARSLNGIGDGGQPDPGKVADVLARHPREAIEEVRLTKIDGRPYGPRTLLLALGHLDLRALGYEPQSELAEAVAHIEENEAEIRARQNPENHARRELAELLDHDGDQVDPAALLRLSFRSRDIEPRHRDLLLELTEQWWPTKPIDDIEDGDSPETTRAALVLGEVLTAPLKPARWEQLLDAHLAHRRRPWDLGGDGVLAWLVDTYEPGLQRLVLRRIAAAEDAEQLSCLIALGRRSDEAEVVGAAAVRRLQELGPETPWWSNVIGLLADRAGASIVQPLLDGSLNREQERAVIAAQARTGDGEAQLKIVQALADEVSTIDDLEPPHWFERARLDVGVVSALADAALVQGNAKITSFAIGLLGVSEDVDALQALLDLATRHGQPRGLRLEARRLARVLARLDVSARLPEELEDLVGLVQAELAQGS